MIKALVREVVVTCMEKSRWIQEQPSAKADRADSEVGSEGGNKEKWGR